MPSIRIAGPYEIYFTSHDRGEPAHVHVDRENMAAKFWLSPISVAYNLGYARHELRKIERLIRENRELCLRKWDEYFGTQSG
ncbi:MAG TPA: DUF4160 domain-containing protein [Thermoanaerobaculia bacterium]|nr:DUF4160 domain-containing protein [Thermoanaerobaculia bacterium]